MIYPIMLKLKRGIIKMADILMVKLRENAFPEDFGFACSIDKKTRETFLTNDLFNGNEVLKSQYLYAVEHDEECKSDAIHPQIIFSYNEKWLININVYIGCTTIQKFTPVEVPEEYMLNILTTLLEKAAGKRYFYDVYMNKILV